MWPVEGGRNGTQETFQGQNENFRLEQVMQWGTASLAQAGIVRIP